MSAALITKIPTQVLSSTAANTLTLSSFFRDRTIKAGDTVVDLRSSNGSLPIELTDSATPQTVANFLRYVTSGEYANTIIHRSVPGFVIQGGGYTTNAAHIATFGTVPGEAATATLKNTTGTIAMALSTGPNSGTSEFFFNLGANPNLDDASNGGPFTAFGKLIYNGTNVANAIAGLGKIDASSINSAFTDLPVQSSYTGPTGTQSPLPTATASLSPMDLVSINPVILPGGLTYSVTSANPLVAKATITNGVLTVNPTLGGVAGSTFLTVNATDLAGQSVFAVVPVSFNPSAGPNSSLDVTVGNAAAGGAKQVSYVDANRTLATVTLRGPGSATVSFFGNDLTSSGSSGVVVSGSAISIASITTTGTTAASTLTITTSRGPKVIAVGDITTGSIGSIDAPGVTLTGNLTASGSIGSMSLGAAVNGTVAATSVGTLSVRGAFDDNLVLNGGGTVLGKFASGSITNGIWTLTGSVNSISSGSATDWGLNVTQSVNSIQLAGGGLSGGAITLGSVGTFNIKGSVFDSDTELTGSGLDLKTLSVGGSINGSLFNAAGSYGKINADALINTRIYAGVGNLAANQVFVANLAQFVSQQSIGALSLRSHRRDGSFTNSDVAAANLGKISLGVLQTSNGGTPTGVAAESIATLTGVANKAFTLTRLTPADDGTAKLTALGVVLGDFLINLL